MTTPPLPRTLPGLARVPVIGSVGAAGRVAGRPAWVMRGLRKRAEMDEGEDDE